MKQYEYTLVPIPMGTEYLSNLNAHGKLGWQVVNIHTTDGIMQFVTFMREKR